MQDLVDRLLARPSLQQARMAGAAVRGPYHQSPDDTMTSLASWCTHPNTFVRVASGVAYGVVGQRDRDALSKILPYVERLADDTEADVREHGAEAALESLFLAHSDALWTILEDWIDAKNDRVREVIARTIARIATSGKINRPSLLRRLIERGLELYERMIPGASPTLVAALATALDGMGCLAPEIVTPHVRRWGQSDDASTLALVADIARTPYGALCDGFDTADGAHRPARLREEAAREAAAQASPGEGDVAYAQLTVETLLHEQPSAHLPWRWIADPYRGCQLRCEFCNARMTSEWAGDGDAAFVRRVSVVQNVATQIHEDLGRECLEPRDRNVLCLGALSDPYQPAEEHFEATRQILKACLEHRHPVIVQTRQELVLRDLHVLGQLAEHGLVNVYVGMQSSVEGIRNKVELGTSTIPERFRAMRMLSARGVPVALLLSPIMPGISDDPKLLEETIETAGDAGASWVVGEVLNLHGSARTKVHHFLTAYVPGLLAQYREMYTAGARPGDPCPEYEARITEELLPELARRHGLTDTSRMLTCGRETAICLKRL